MQNTQTMCNRYISPGAADLERIWSINKPTFDWATRQVFPRGLGSFIRKDEASPDELGQLVVGQWGLVPWFAKTPKLTYSTNNCRWESAATAASFKQSWQSGRRCLIPAWEFFEPNWESGKNEWWSFRRADERPLGLAGLWNTWTDKSTGEIVESYTMLTMNADAHPLMRRMHKPDPKFSSVDQDKRSVVVIEEAEFENWLSGSTEQAAALVELTDESLFLAKPEASRISTL
jgi:putative SOS response-associated peptidase YedK